MKYELVRKLGQGRWTVAYLATAVNGKGVRGARVVLKTVQPQLTAPPLVRRFRREALIALPLVHPHLVKVLDAGMADVAPVHVLEWVDGCTLEQMAQLGPLGSAEAVQVVEDVGEALLYLEGRQHDGLPFPTPVIDRKNVLVTKDGIAKLTEYTRPLGDDNDATHVTGKNAPSTAAVRGLGLLLGELLLPSAGASRSVHMPPKLLDVVRIATGLEQGLAYTQVVHLLSALRALHGELGMSGARKTLGALAGKAPKPPQTEVGARVLEVEPYEAAPVASQRATVRELPKAALDDNAGTATVSRRPRLGEILIARGKLSSAEADAAAAIAEELGIRVGAALVERGLVSELELIKALSHQYQLGYVADEVLEALRPDIARQLPRSVARRLGVLPLQSSEQELVLASFEPLEPRSVEELKRFAPKGHLRTVLATPSGLLRTMSRLFPDEPEFDIDVQSPVSHSEKTVLVKPGER